MAGLVFEYKYVLQWCVSNYIYKDNKKATIGEQIILQYFYLTEEQMKKYISKYPFMNYAFVDAWCKELLKSFLEIFGGVNNKITVPLDRTIAECVPYKKITEQIKKYSDIIEFYVKLNWLGIKYIELQDNKQYANIDIVNRQINEIYVNKMPQMN